MTFDREIQNIMIVGNSFKGDNNDTLKQVQHDSYLAFLPWMLEYAKKSYLEALNIVGARFELGDQIEGITLFDHRVLQDAHDTIAAYYRYEYPDKAGKLVLPQAFSNGDTALTATEALKELYLKEWSNFWHKENKNLARSGEIVRAILSAVVYQNTAKGYEAENLLVCLLKERYGMD